MVFLPLRDDNPLKIIPFQFATVTLIVINVIVFMWQDVAGEARLNDIAMSAGVIPNSLLGSKMMPALPGFGPLPSEATLITYMFLHGDWWHLIGNMLFLWVFGDNVEDAMGSIRFIFFYLLCGVAAGLAHVYANLGSDAPLIGASGATSGVVGAYLMLYPRVRMWVLAFMRIPLKIPALWVILAYIATQFFFVFSGIENGTAWWAHIGGVIAGMFLVVFFRRSGVRLFAGAPER
jgi:membrane associated rhomboid family serine protease